jgi:two-component sensor histidine kinase
LAVYSFVEYETGLRSESSMLDLMAKARSSYVDALACAYYRAPGRPHLLGADAWAEEAKESLDASSHAAWESFAAGERVLAYPGPTKGPDAFFMLFQPVRVEGQLRGVVGVAVGLGRAIERYLVPMAEEGRYVSLSAVKGPVLWSSSGPDMPTFDARDLSMTRSFPVEDCAFSVTEYDSGAAIKDDLAVANTLRTIILGFVLVMEAGAVYIALRLYLSELRRSALAREEQLLSDTVAEKNRELAESALRFKAAFEDREVLLHELSHRVKNNLHFLDSLIELQKAREAEGAREALAKMQSRIGAIAAAYFVAADAPESFRIDVDRYLGMVGSYIQDEVECRGVRFSVSLSAASGHLPLDVVVPLGLILRELLVNAAIHGYGTGKSGFAEVTFRLCDGLAELVVRDHGAGMAESVREGLGLMMVRALARQLDGTFAYYGSGPGVLARTTFPWLEVSEPRM